VGQVIGDLLPLAVGVAISPISIIAAILMLLSKRRRPASGFLLGWIVGIVAVTIIVLILVGQANNTASGTPSTVSVIKIVLGALLVLMAARQWQKRPKERESAAMPKWMGAIDSFTFVEACGLGVLLSAVNPKNLIMCVAAGTTIGAAHLSRAQDIIAVVAFTGIAAGTVVIPVIANLSARTKM
jgi:threonine/homoserine/homoserine lactone efflux protein